MKRYTIYISFNCKMFENVDNVVENVKTLKEAMSYKEIVDDTVNKAFIKDNVTNKIINLK